MTFRQFAFNNIFRNKRLYVAYFLSSLFTVMVFFTFAIFAFHPILKEEQIDSKVIIGLSVAGGIIYIFSLFFVLYSMSSFLQSRKKEFGVLKINGMSDRQLRWMVFLENMVIGLLATIIGIMLGLVFSKAMLLVAENVLVADISLHFYFPLLAIIITFVSFILLFFMISLFVIFILRTKKLVQLIKGNEMGKEEPRFSIILVLLAVLLLGLGYTIAILVKGLYVAAALIPVAILVTLGTYLLFTQLSVFLIRKLKGNRRLFWKNTNMLLFSDLSYRMKDNARSFFMVAIISTVSFSAIGTLYGLNSFLTKGVIDANPTSFSYIPETDYDESQITDDLNFIENTLKEYNLTTDKEKVNLTYFQQNEDDFPVLITTEDKYNQYAKLIGEREISVAGHDVVPVPESGRTIQMPFGDAKMKEITLTDGSTIPIDMELEGIAKRDVLPEMYRYYIVNDAVFEKLGNPVEAKQYYNWQVTSGSQEEIIEAGEVMTEELTHHIIPVDYTVYTIRTVYAPIMFVGLFIGLIFFISAGSFLYFRLYADLEEDKKKFRAISKIGLTMKEMNKVISQQTAILFFTPIIVAIIHGAIALTALSHMFDYNLVRESIYVLGGFFLIQVIYYIVVRYFYTRQIKLNIK